MAEAKFGEPWLADRYFVNDCNDNRLAEFDGQAGWETDKEYACRAIACVNACSGIENPGAIPNLVQTVRDFVEKCPAFAECAELDAALAALESKGGE